jgi:predicted AlkP superfamily pyrophosphatase or phosphodiesterase
MILFVALDGLRPDQISEEDTPNLLRVARRGVRFMDHHAVFPTETRVQVASIMTGCYTSRHGLVGNSFYLPATGPPWEVNAGDYREIARLDEETGGHALQVETLGAILAAEGLGMVSVGVGTSGSGMLHNHKAGEVGGVIVHPEFSVPASEQQELERIFGPWPEPAMSSTARMRYGTTVLLEHLIPKYSPALATLWLPEPDSAQHKTAISSPEALEGTRQADAQLGRILEYLEATGQADSTDLLVASDHGHSTVTGTVDVAQELVASGLKAGPDSHDVLISGVGGSILVYIREGGPRRVKAVTEFLMAQPWCGPLFASASDTVPGSLPMSILHAGNPRSPDILFSFAWDGSHNSHGLNGGVFCARGKIPVGAGIHGSTSLHEVHNVLVAAGPHFKPGVESAVPSGNVDILPTICHILGIAPSGERDGRVLREALVDGPGFENVTVERQTHRASTKTGGGSFEQEAQVSRVGGTAYLDQATARHA